MSPPAGSRGAPSSSSRATARSCCTRPWAGRTRTRRSPMRREPDPSDRLLHQADHHRCGLATVRGQQAAGHDARGACCLPELKDLKVAVDASRRARRECHERASEHPRASRPCTTSHDAPRRLHVLLLSAQCAAQNYRDLGIDRIDNMRGRDDMQKLAGLPSPFPRDVLRILDRDRPAGPYHRTDHRQELDVALKELVLDPLKMRETTFHVQGAALTASRPLSNDPDMWVFEWLDVIKAPKRFSGGAGMASTAMDYYRAAADGGQWRRVKRHAPALTVNDALGDGRSDRHDARSWRIRAMATPGICSTRYA